MPSPLSRTRRRLRRFARSWRIGWRITGLNLRAQLEYRGEFLMRIVFGIAWQVSIIVFAAVLLSRFSGMGGWSSSEILLIAATRMTCNALYVLYCGNTFMLAFLVQQGMIDGYLLRPLPVYRQVQLSSFPTNGLGDLAVGLALFAGALHRSSLHWTPGSVAYLAAAVIGGTLLISAIFTTLSAAALHFPAAWYWSTWVSEIASTFGSYPLSILPRAAGGLLTWVLPIAFIAYFPIGVLTGHGSALGVPVAVAAGAPLIALGMYFGSRLLWNWSLTHYSGVNG
jgi:ABC-2 type transport system permease protein